MNVSFMRMGERRYAVIVEVPEQPPRTLSPAPGYDDDIPHDLVHYVVEAELRLSAGVYGRAAVGGGTFIAEREAAAGRERSRQLRRQRKRERALQARDERGAHEMARSEQLAAMCDIAWRRKHGQRPDPLRAPPPPPTKDDAAAVARMVARLDKLAPLWRALPVGGKLTFVWPSTQPTPSRADGLLAR